MRSLIVGFALGVCLLQIQGNLPGYAALLLLSAALLLLILLLLRAHRPAWRMLLVAGCGAATGFVWAALFAQVYLSEELPSALEGQDLVVVGTVDNLPYRVDQGQRFNFAIEQAEWNGKAVPVPRRVALSWYAHAGEDDIAPASVRPGERWRLRLRLQRSHGNANLGGFDYEAWLLEQRVRATGSVRTDPAAQAQNARLDAFVWSVHNLVQRLREAMRERIVGALPGERYAGMVVALVIGDERGVGQSDWNVVNRSGISHLVAVSGLRTSKS